MDISVLFEKYGWLAVIVLWLLPRVWQFVTERFYPERVKERLEAERAERETRVTLMKAQIDREDRESDRRLALEERMVRSFEQLSLAVSVGNERMAALIASFTQHANFQFGAHVELKEKLDDIQDLISVNQRVEQLEKGLKDTQEKIQIDKK